MGLFQSYIPFCVSVVFFQKITKAKSYLKNKAFLKKIKSILASPSPWENSYLWNIYYGTSTVGSILQGVGSPNSHNPMICTLLFLLKDEDPEAWRFYVTSPR